MNKSVDIIVDLQFGSTGKGAIAGYLATVRPYDMVVSANRPNAGHTFIDAKGQKMIHKVLPNGAAGPSVRHVMIGPGAVFNMPQMLAEIDQLERFGYSNFAVYIHEAAVVLTEQHRADESVLSRIGSTQQGSATAIVDKMMRDEKHDPTVKHVEINHPRIIVVSPNEYHSMLSNANHILAEGAQGYSLGIDAGFWPYCTSRNCTVNAFLSDMAIPHTMLDRVIGTARTYPIRVAGNSGPCYPDQEELSWEDVGVEEEFTTVTKKVRRVFTFSNMQIREAMQANQCDEIFLNFCNYLNTEDCGTIAQEIDQICQDVGVGWVRYMGHGPAVGDMVDMADVWGDGDA